MKKTTIVANWKMNPGSSKEAWDLAEAVKRGVAEIRDVKVVLCPPFVYLSALIEGGSAFAQGFGGLAFGSQDCFWEDQGAFTGEVSPSMLRELGCSYVILGHSERKNYLGESFEMINKKIKAALAAGLIPVVCIGEKLEQEMREVLKAVTPEQARKLVLVYEPEWAISTNKGAAPARPEDCGRAIALMAKVAQEMFGDIQIPILYGGSTNSENIKGFIESGAQGALVGSASLDAQEFIELVKNAAMR